MTKIEKPKPVTFEDAKKFSVNTGNRQFLFKIMASEVFLGGHIRFWSEGYKGEGIKVAVLDSGIEMTSLFFKSCTNVIGKSFVPGENWNQDTLGHGTFVASMFYHKINLQEATNYKEIICCSCPNLEQLQIYKVADKNGGINWNNLEMCLRYLLLLADSERPHIINMSFATFGDMLQTEQGKRIDEQLRELKEKGTLIFAGSGNFLKSVGFPANSEHVFAIGSTMNGWEQLARFNTGGKELDYVADGYEVLGVRNNNKKEYNKWSGSSMSSPNAARLAALTLCYMAEKDTYAAFIKLKDLTRFWKEKGFVKDSGIQGFDESFGFGVLGFWENIKL